MAARPSFSPILGMKSSEAKAPPPMPVGTYVWVTKGLPRFDKSTKKGTPFAEFTVTCLGALDDVDQEALAASGGFKDKVKTMTYYLTEKSAFMLRDFLVDDLGIDDDDGDAELEKLIDQSAGKQFLGHIKHEPSQDGKRVYDNIDATAPIDS